MKFEVLLPVSLDPSFGNDGLQHRTFGHTAVRHTYLAHVGVGWSSILRHHSPLARFRYEQFRRHPAFLFTALEYQSASLEKHLGNFFLLLKQNTGQQEPRPMAHVLRQWVAQWQDRLAIEIS